MDPPPVQYVTTSDGYNIAYGVSSSGPPILVLPAAFEHVQLAWQYPALGDWLRALTARFTVVQMDMRGAGLSTRSLGADFAFEHYQRDIEAVVEHLRLDHMVIWGTIQGCFVAARYAIDNPGRVRALIFTRPAGLRAPAFITGVAPQDWDLFLHGLVPRDRSPDEARRQVGLLKQSFEQENFVRRARAGAEDDILNLYERLVTPTLVLHPRDYALADVSSSIHAAQVLGASLTLIDGSYVFGDAEQGVRAIDDFLSKLPVPQETLTPAAGLSSREVEVLHLLAAGRSNAQIADELVISLNTVRRHVSNIFDKTGVANRAEAASFAARHGIA